VQGTSRSAGSLGGLKVGDLHEFEVPSADFWVRLECESMSGETWTVPLRVNGRSGMVPSLGDVGSGVRVWPE
jgi:hypothetical protein